MIIIICRYNSKLIVNCNRFIITSNNCLTETRFQSIIHKMCFLYVYSIKLLINSLSKLILLYVYNMWTPFTKYGCSAWFTVWINICIYLVFCCFFTTLFVSGKDMLGHFWFGVIESCWILNIIMVKKLRLFSLLITVVYT